MVPKRKRTVDDRIKQNNQKLIKEYNLINQQHEDDEHEIDDIFSSKKPKNSIPTSVSSVPTVVFEDTPYSASNNKSDYRSFMSSKIKTLVKEKVVDPKLSKEEQEEEAQHLQHDRELKDLINASKLIEEYTASELFGKERRSYMQRKVEELSKVSVKTAKMNAPHRIRMGMEKKEIERAQKKLQESKDMGMYHSSTKHIYTDEILSKKLLKPKQSWEKKIMKKNNTGGVMKDGVLHIKKDAIEANSSKGKKAFKKGNVGNKAFGNIGLSDKRKKDKKKKKKKGSFM